jgi:hypothetical protein
MSETKFHTAVPSFWPTVHADISWVMGPISVRGSVSPYIVATNIYAFMNSPNDARLPTIASPHL